MRKLYIILVLFSLSFSTVTDIDGNSYFIIQIGDQLWMKENLKSRHYRNGDIIPNIVDNSDWENLSTGAYSDYDNKGVLANNFKVFEKFQNQLGIIKTQISEVKDISIENLEETKKLSKQIEESKKELGEKIDQISPQNKLDQSKMKLQYLIHFDYKKIRISLQI